MNAYVQPCIHAWASSLNVGRWVKLSLFKNLILIESDYYLDLTLRHGKEKHLLV